MCWMNAVCWLFFSLATNYFVTLLSSQDAFLFALWFAAKLSSSHGLSFTPSLALWQEMVCLTIITWLMKFLSLPRSSISHKKPMQYEMIRSFTNLFFSSSLYSLGNFGILFPYATTFPPLVGLLIKTERWSESNYHSNYPKTSVVWFLLATLQGLRKEFVDQNSLWTTSSFYSI